MINGDIANEIFRNVGKEYGYENVSVDFVSFQQFKVQWQRSYNWITFKVSDYVKDAPCEILEDLARSLFERIAGRKGEYSDRFKAYVLASEFSQIHRKTFIKRGRFLYKDGEHKDLADSVDRLIKTGLIPEDHNIEVVWSHNYTELASTYSTLMRTATVNYLLDDQDTPDEVLDYVVYHQYLNIEAGSKTFGTDETIDINEDLKKFDRHAEMVKELDKRCLAL